MTKNMNIILVTLEKSKCFVVLFFFFFKFFLSCMEYLTIISIYISIHLSFCLSCIYQSYIIISIYPSICLFIYQTYIHISNYLSICPSICTCVCDLVGYKFLHPPIFLSIYLYIHLSINLSLYVT